MPAAEADARRIAAALASTYPDSHRGRSFRLLPLRVEQYEFTLGLFSLVQLLALGVLLVAAANAITIMSVTVLDGRAESALRAALGASVARIGRPSVIAIGGMYGMAASAVASRRRELGIRVVLGAGPLSLAWLILEVVVQPVAAGCVVGAMAATWLARLVGSHTFGLLTGDPLVTLGVGSGLMAAAVLCAWTPCRRAGHVDPIVAHRE